MLDAQRFSLCERGSMKEELPAADFACFVCRCSRAVYPTCFFIKKTCRAANRDHLALWQIRWIARDANRNEAIRPLTSPGTVGGIWRVRDIHAIRFFFLLGNATDLHVHRHHREVRRARGGNGLAARHVSDGRLHRERLVKVRRAVRIRIRRTVVDRLSVRLPLEFADATRRPTVRHITARRVEQCRTRIRPHGNAGSSRVRAVKPHPLPARRRQAVHRERNGAVSLASASGTVIRTYHMEIYRPIAGRNEAGPRGGRDGLVGTCRRPGITGQ